MKKNPNRIPATMADVNRARKQGQEDGIKVATAAILSALLDGGYLRPEQMTKAWAEIRYRSDSIRKGYCSLNDIGQMLKEEYGIE